MLESIDVDDRLTPGGSPASRYLFVAAAVLASSVAAGQGPPRPATRGS